jgi:hypothetical protein
LEHWLFIVLTLYAYFLNIGSVLEPNPDFMVINPAIFRGESGISKEELEKVLTIISEPPLALKEKLTSAMGTDARYDFIDFRSSPLIQLDENKLLPTDLAFLLDKCHTGVQWALHDALPIKLRQSLFNAWGALFEEYVHWLFKGVTTTSVFYFPSPKWKKGGYESFDGIVLKGDVMLAAECKGGFITRAARYSGDSTAFCKDLDKKMTVGCRQLAEKIGLAFAEQIEDRRELEDLDCKSIRAVVPVLILQDHILRVPFVNWYLNVQFQKFIAEEHIRPGVVIRPLTVLMVHELESIVHSAESEQFDFVYALHNRTLRDPDVLSNLSEWLSQYQEFGRNPSPRLAKILEQVSETISSFLFPELVKTSGKPLELK